MLYYKDRPEGLQGSQSTAPTAMFKANPAMIESLRLTGCYRRLRFMRQNILSIVMQTFVHNTDTPSDIVC